MVLGHSTSLLHPGAPPEFWVQPGLRAPYLRFSPIITAPAMIMAICSVQEGPVVVLVGRWPSGRPALIWNDTPERAQTTKSRG